MTPPTPFPAMIPVPVQSSMVDSFREQTVKCRHCGFTPVRRKTVSLGRVELFAYDCPNCCGQSYSRMWQPTKQKAADVWNAANKI